MPRRASLVRLTGGEQRNYAFRIHQLEQDVRRDGTDFDVLRRLGQLHLRLAVCDVDGRGSHLRRARYYLRRAADVVMASREAQLIHSLIDAANSPNPALDLIGMPGEMGPPPRVDEAVVRMRLGWLEEQISYRPNSARLLTRLGDNYTALYHALVRGGGRRSGRWPAESGVNDAEEARRLAEHDYGRALQCATTQEARCRALYGIAQLFRETEEPARAATALRQLLTLQPNNWFAALEMSRLSQQLGQSEEVARYQALADRWRTPAWM